MDLLKLPSGDSDKGTVKRYMGTRAAWLPGSDLPFLSGLAGLGKPFAKVKHGAAFGGNVYSQGALATCRALAEEEEKKGLANTERLGLHVSYHYTPCDQSWRCSMEASPRHHMASKCRTS